MEVGIYRMSMNNKNNLLIALSITIFLSLWLIFFWETLAGTVNTWDTSDTYGHGYLIPILSLYFIWLKRFELKATSIKPFYLATLPIIALCLLWLLGELTYTNVVKQFAVFLLPFFFVLLVFGQKICRTLAFPLLFLIFCVPFGEGLIPLLQVITAEITIYFIEIIGIPVYVDGLFITLTSGIFEVAKACSGISYLISSLAIGSFYAFTTYSSPKRRLLFILFSLVVPVIANGLRALLIVLLAHYSDLAIATGFDHLIYGWVFFGLIMFIMFFVGGKWAEQDVFKSKIWLDKQAKPKMDGNILFSLIFILSPLVLVKVYSQQIDSVKIQAWPASHFIQQSKGWDKSLLSQKNAISSFAKADKIQFEQFIKDDMSITFYGAYFKKESESNEFISFENVIYNIDDWALDKSEIIKINGFEFSRYEIVNTVGDRKQIVFTYIIGGAAYTSPMRVKLAMLENKLFNGQASALYVSFASDYNNSNPQIKKEILDFIEEHSPQFL